MSSEALSSLNVCPCGKVPVSLFISPGGSCKRAYVCGECCGEWNIEFRTQYHELDSAECEDLAREAWNDATRQ